MSSAVAAAELAGILEFLRRAEKLKDTLRSGHTSDGRQESAAEHTWRLCLMAIVLEPYYPEIDIARLIKLCVVHDLGEAIGGDVPAPQQDASQAKAEQERRDYATLLTALPAPLHNELLDLWDEYEAAVTPAARLAKALDKLETILQHNQGRNPPDFDYRYNLEYGRQYTMGDPLVVDIRRILDRETERRAQELQGGG